MVPLPFPVLYVRPMLSPCLSRQRAHFVRLSNQAQARRDEEPGMAPSSQLHLDLHRIYVLTLVFLPHLILPTRTCTSCGRPKLNEH